MQELVSGTDAAIERFVAGAENYVLGECWRRYLNLRLARAWMLPETRSTIDFVGQWFREIAHGPQSAPPGVSRPGVLHDAVERARQAASTTAFYAALVQPETVYALLEDVDRYRNCGMLSMPHCYEDARRADRERG